MLLLTGALMTTIFETWHWAYILSSWLGFYSKSSIMKIGILRESQLEISTFSLVIFKTVRERIIFETILVFEDKWLERSQDSSLALKWKLFKEFRSI